jgi:lipopolysaccharide/colanic/teichoic acid biosynthesis glycosyltransferase
MIIIALAILIFDGRPIFYLSDRARGVGQTFRLVKFRTMWSDPKDFGASGGHKTHRITRIGAILRRSRLDEFPQLFNIIAGDMSLVGPRPPLPLYVELFPEIYGKVLRSRPGVTGLASIYYHEHEDWLLRSAKSSEQTEAIYRRACIPRKARLDLIYERNQSLCFDILLMMRTVCKRFR